MQEKSNGVIIIGNKWIKLSYGGPLTWDGGFCCHPRPLGFLGLRAAPRTFFFFLRSCSTSTTRNVVADFDLIFFSAICFGRNPTSLLVFSFVCWSRETVFFLSVFQWILFEFCAANRDFS
jgi:hypothetical protein